MNNNILAEHDGIYNFTVGQRRGIGVSKENPVYVKEIDATTNRVIVAEKEYIEYVGLDPENPIWQNIHFDVSTSNSLNKLSKVFKTRS